MLTSVIFSNKALELFKCYDERKRYYLEAKIQELGAWGWSLQLKRIYEKLLNKTGIETIWK